MQSEQFITIQGWMRTELNLKGNDLMVYAIIYGFCQDGENHFTGSLQYLADWCGATKQGIQKNLKNLIDNGYIEKFEVEKNGVRFCEYSCIVCNKVAHSEQQHSCIVCNSVVHPMQQSCINNIDNNIDNKDIIPINRNNTSEQEKSDFEQHSYSPAEMRESFLGSNKSARKVKTPKKSLYSKCEDEILLYTKNLELQDVLIDYLQFRLSVRDKPLYGVNQWKGLLNTLSTLAKDDKTKVKIVLQSTAKGWLSFYPFKEFNSILNVRDDVFSEGDGVSCESADDTEEDRRENLRNRGRRTYF